MATPSSVTPAMSATRTSRSGTDSLRASSISWKKSTNRESGCITASSSGTSTAPVTSLFTDLQLSYGMPLPSHLTPAFQQTADVGAEASGSDQNAAGLPPLASDKKIDWYWLL